METQKHSPLERLSAPTSQDFNKDVKDHFKRQRKYVSNDGLITFYTLNDKITYDKCVDKHDD
jgi:hypothetical protein